MKCTGMYLNFIPYCWWPEGVETDDTIEEIIVEARDCESDESSSDDEM